MWISKERKPQWDARLGSKNDINKKVENKSRLLKFKKASLASTWNFRTVSSQNNKGKVTGSAEKYGIDIVCIEEHHIFQYSVYIKHHDMEKKWVLLTGSAQKALNHTEIRSVGLLMNSKACKSLNSVQTVSPRIMLASFNGNLEVTISSCPTMFQMRKI